MASSRHWSPTSPSDHHLRPAAEGIQLSRRGLGGRPAHCATDRREWSLALSVLARQIDGPSMTRAAILGSGQLRHGSMPTSSPAACVAVMEQSPPEPPTLGLVLAATDNPPSQRSSSSVSTFTWGVSTQRTCPSQRPRQRRCRRRCSRGWLSARTPAETVGQRACSLPSRVGVKSARVRCARSGWATPDRSRQASRVTTPVRAVVKSTVRPSPITARALRARLRFA